MQKVKRPHIVFASQPVGAISDGSVQFWRMHEAGRHLTHGFERQVAGALRTGDFVIAHVGEKGHRIATQGQSLGLSDVAAFGLLLPGDEAAGSSLSRLEGLLFIGHDVLLFWVS
jgi:hypothetical protein